MRRRLVLLSALVLLGCGASQAPVRAPVQPVEASTADAEAAARDLAGHVDSHLGIVVVEQIMETETEPRPMRRATLRCGDQITALSAELATYLAARPAAEAPPWSCTAADCELPGVMEYDPNRILRFGRADDGRVIVRAYFAIDALAVAPEQLAQTRQNADQTTTSSASNGASNGERGRGGGRERE